MKYVVYQASRRGGRPVNEDRVDYAYTSDALFMIVADGMGGHNYGEVASQLLVETMVGLFKTRATPRLPNLQGFLLDGIYAAHEAINEYALGKGLTDPPRTTCVAAVVQDGMACWAHVGDSRLYHFDKRSLVQRTRDHSAVQWLVDQGLLDEDQISLHPDRNKLFNCVGGYALPDIELSELVPLKEGDVLLLCSDGVWSEIKDREMLAALRAYPLDLAIRHMLDHAELRGGRYCDNLSIVAMRYGEERFEEGEPVLGNDFGLEGFTTPLKQLTPQAGERVYELDIDRAIAEIHAALAEHGLDKS